MKRFRLLLTGLSLALLCGILVVACHNEDLTIQESAALEDSGDQLSMRVDADDSDAADACELGLNFIPLTDELREVYESEGLEVLLDYMEIQNSEIYPDACKVDSDKKYCNYTVAEVVDPPQPITPYPGPGWRFCVVCPPRCGPFGLLYSVNPVTPNGTHYVAYVKLNQAGPGCEKCNANTVVPRAN